MKLYYWRAKQNFGDQLSGLLLKKFSHLSSEWAPPEKAQLVMAGSVLEHLSPDFNGVIAGAGKLHEGSKLSFPHAQILAVRGPLTAQALGLKPNVVTADPGLLADELVPLEDKVYNLGIVPHWTDYELEKDERFLKYNPRIIRPEGDVLSIISEIGRCKKIVSSSLHGIILADAFGIPRRIEIPKRALSHPHQEGGLFKWNDYSRSLSIKLEIGITQLIDRNKITERQHELFEVFEEIKKIFT